MPRGNSGASSSPRSSLIRQNSASSGARSPLRIRNDSQVSATSDGGSNANAALGAIEHMGGDHLIQNDDDAAGGSDDDDADELNDMMQQEEEDEDDDGDEDEEEDDDGDDEDGVEFSFGGMISKL